MIGVGLGEDLEDMIIGPYQNMKKEDAIKADLILTGIKSFVCQILMKRVRTTKTGRGKKMNKELDIATGSESRQKR